GRQIGAGAEGESTLTREPLRGIVRPHFRVPGQRFSPPVNRGQAYAMSVAERSAAGTVGSVTQRDMANAIRALSMDAVEKAKSGHPGMPMGMADVATVLFTQCLKYDPADPHWPDRDRFVLSAGHGSMLLYSLLYLTGYG